MSHNSDFFPNSEKNLNKSKLWDINSELWDSKSQLQEIYETELKIIAEAHKRNVWSQNSGEKTLELLWCKLQFKMQFMNCEKSLNSELSHHSEIFPQNWHFYIVLFHGKNRLP